MTDVKIKEEGVVEEAVEETVDAPEAVETTEESVDEAVEKAVAAGIASAVEASKKEVSDFIASQKKSIEAKSGLYAEEVKSSRKELNDSTRTFLKALSINDVATLKEMSEGTGAEGGYIVDRELDAEIRHLVTEYGVARREAETMTLSVGYQLDLTNLATDVDVYWTDEAGAKTSSDVTLGRVTLTLNKLAVIVGITDELLEDAEIDLVAFLTRRIAEKIAQKEDQAFFNGDGTAAFGGFTGLLNAAGVGTSTTVGNTFDAVTADDLIDAVDATPQGALANGKFFMHRSIMSQIRKLQSTDGQYVYQAPSAGGPATIWGYPVVLVEAMPSIGDSAASTPFIIFGDVRKSSVVGFKGGLQVKISQDAVIRNVADSADINLFRQDMSGLRVVERFGLAHPVPSAVTVISTNA